MQWQQGTAYILNCTVRINGINNYELRDAQSDSAFNCFNSTILLANSNLCCFFRYSWAIVITILMKKFRTIIHTMVFHTKLKDRFNCFPCKTKYKSVSSKNRKRQHPGNVRWNTKLNLNLIKLPLSKGLKKKTPTFTFEGTGADKYFSLAVCNLTVILGSKDENPGIKPSNHSSSFSSNSSSWLLQTKMIKTVWIMKSKIAGRLELSLVIVLLKFHF